MKRFYTYVKCIEYPYIMRNIKQKPLKSFTHEIVDIGIYDLLKPPYEHSEDKLKLWRNLKTIGWKVVPDFPDIDKEFRLKTGIDNVEKSKQLMIDFFDSSKDNYLPVIQGNRHNIDSFEDYMKWIIKEYGVLDKIAIGTVCKATSKLIVGKTAKLTRKYFPNASIHIFGLKQHHYTVVRDYINSFDSMSWTFPRKSGLPTAKNTPQREKYFAEYIFNFNRYDE